jgi:hypothetical protein
VFSEKTAVGSWIERSGGPSGYHRGFSTEEYETEAQHLQYGANKPKFYGAGLPLDEEVEHPRVVKDIFHPRSGPTIKDWKSNTHSMMESVLVPKVRTYFDQTVIISLPAQTEHNYAADCGRTIKNLNDQSKIEDYRASWTTDTNEGRKLRFNTESRRAANSAVGESFQVPSLRLVPGVPNGFEKILSGLTSRYGILGLTAFRYEIWSVLSGRRSSSRGSSRQSPRSSPSSFTPFSSNVMISADDFKIILKSCDVKLSRIEYAQVMAYMTSGESFSVDRLLTILTPVDDDFQVNQVKDKFVAAFNGRSSVSADEIGSLYPAIERELSEFIQVYCHRECSGRNLDDDDEEGNGSRYEMNKEGFIQLHTDLYHSVPLRYKKIFA